MIPIFIHRRPTHFRADRAKGLCVEQNQDEEKSRKKSVVDKKLKVVSENQKRDDLAKKESERQASLESLIAESAHVC